MFIQHYYNLCLPITSTNVPIQTTVGISKWSSAIIFGLVADLVICSLWDELPLQRLNTDVLQIPIYNLCQSLLRPGIAKQKLTQHRCPSNTNLQLVSVLLLYFALLFVQAIVVMDHRLSCLLVVAMNESVSHLVLILSYPLWPFLASSYLTLSFL